MSSYEEIMQSVLALQKQVQAACLDLEERERALRERRVRAFLREYAQNRRKFGPDWSDDRLRADALATLVEKIRVTKRPHRAFVERIDDLLDYFDF